MGRHDQRCIDRSHSPQDQFDHSRRGCLVLLPGRLVGQHETGPSHEGSSQGRSLELPPGQLLGKLLSDLRQPEQLDHLERLAPGVILATPGEDERQRDVLGHRERWHEAGTLERHRHQSRSQERPVTQRGPLDRARGRDVQPGHQVQQRRLAAPGRTDQDDAIPRAHRERRARHRGHTLVGRSEPAAHAVGSDQHVIHRGLSRPRA